MSKRRSAKTKASPIDDDNRPECKFGASCYRKNAAHLKEFRHPTPTAAASDSAAAAPAAEAPTAAAAVAAPFVGVPFGASAAFPPAAVTPRSVAGSVESRWNMVSFMRLEGSPKSFLVRNRRLNYVSTLSIRPEPVTDWQLKLLPEGDPAYPDDRKAGSFGEPVLADIRADARGGRGSIAMYDPPPPKGAPPVDGFLSHRWNFEFETGPVHPEDAERELAKAKLHDELARVSRREADKKRAARQRKAGKPVTKRPPSPDMGWRPPCFTIAGRRPPLVTGLRCEPVQRIGFSGADAGMWLSGEHRGNAATGGWFEVLQCEFVSGGIALIHIKFYHTEPSAPDDIAIGEARWVDPLRYTPVLRLRWADWARAIVQATGGGDSSRSSSSSAAAAVTSGDGIVMDLALIVAEYALA